MNINIGLINWHTDLKWYWNILKNLFCPIWYNKNKNYLDIYIILIVILIIICYNWL